MSMMYPGFFEHQHRSVHSEQLSGVWNAIVTDNKDPDKQGRVKVKFPLREGDLQTDWIRVATMMAGKEMGTLFIPEVNDEVLVAFMMGRLDQPVVIGALWNAKDKPPAPNDKNDIRKIKTRSGHEIIFDDNSSNGGVTVKTKAGHSIVLSDKDKSIKLETENKQQSVELDGSGNKIVVKSGSMSTVEMNGQGDVKIDAKKSISIKGVQVKIEADGMLEIKTNGVLTLKGSMVKIN